MYSETNTEEIILARMKASMPSGVSTVEGTLSHAALAATSSEFSAAYQAMDATLARFFPVYAVENGYSEELELKAAERGLERKSGTKATGSVTFTGSNGSVIPAGSLIQTPGLLQYETTAEVTITSGTVSASIQALDIGAIYNVSASQISEIPVQILGVTAVTNSSGITGGSDDETDAELYARYVEACNLPATSGNEAHYKIWAKEVDGIGDARVLSLWNGNGTVKVVVIDTDKRAANQTLVDAVAANIEAERPIGATVTVVAASETAINVTATLTLQAGAVLNDIKALIETELTAYLKSIAFVESLVRYSKIANLIIDTPGVIDYSGLTVNGGTSNVSIANTAVAVKGTVVVTSA